MSWRWKESGHQQPWYWMSWLKRSKRISIGIHATHILQRILTWFFIHGVIGVRFVADLCNCVKPHFVCLRAICDVVHDAVWRQFRGEVIFEVTRHWAIICGVWCDYGSQNYTLQTCDEQTPELTLLSSILFTLINIHFNTSCLNRSVEYQWSVSQYVLKRHSVVTGF